MKETNVIAEAQLTNWTAHFKVIKLCWWMHDSLPPSGICSDVISLKKPPQVANGNLPWPQPHYSQTHILCILFLRRPLKYILFGFLNPIQGEPSSPCHQAMLRTLGIPQFNSMATLSTWRSCQILQISGQSYQTASTFFPHDFRCYL